LQSGVAGAQAGNSMATINSRANTAKIFFIFSFSSWGIGGWDLLRAHWHDHVKFILQPYRPLCK
jgi:hypothetical protein